jgi:deoxyribonuclease IV
MKLGMHFSIAGGLSKSLDRAQALNCQSLQIFLQNPRGWRWREVSTIEIDHFFEKRRLYNLYPIIAHLSYLPNLAAADSQLYYRSWKRLQQELLLGKSLSLNYLVCHPGHAPGDELSIGRLAAGFHRLVSELPPPPLILLENTAGQKNELGNSIADLDQIISLSQVPLGLCLDTAHAFAAGYDLQCSAARQKLLAEIKSGPGLESLKIIHLNDSLFPCGSHRDRHWHLGQGTIGLPGLKHLLAGCASWVEGVILETPKKDPDDDLRNLNVARSLIANAMKETPTSRHPAADRDGDRRPGP